MIDSTAVMSGKGFILAGATSLTYMAGVQLIVAQTIPDLSSSVIVQFLEKGGGWAVLAIVLWSYRRDWQRLVDREGDRAKAEAARAEAEVERNKLLVALLEKANEAQVSMAVALTQNTEVLRTLKAQRNGFDYTERDHP